MLPQSTTLFIRMSPPPNSQEYLMDELRSEAINRGACGPQGVASLPGECPPAAPVSLAGATMEPGVRDAGFWQRRA